VITRSSLCSTSMLDFGVSLHTGILFRKGMHEIGAASVRLDGFVHTHNVRFLEHRGQSVLRSLLAESLSRGHGGEKKAFRGGGGLSLELDGRLDCTVHDDAVGGTWAAHKRKRSQNATASGQSSQATLYTWYFVLRTVYTLMAAAAAITSITSPCRGVRPSGR
jgi:hypothetical protein